MQTSLYTLVTREFTLQESLEMAAKAGFPAVDLRQGRNPEDTVHLSISITDAEAEAVRGMVGAAGLHVSGLTTYYHLGKTDPAEGQAEVDGLRRGFALAGILGARFVRCSGPRLDFVGGYEAAREAFRRQVDTLAEVLTVQNLGGKPFLLNGRQRLGRSSVVSRHRNRADNRFLCLARSFRGQTLSNFVNVGHFDGFCPGQIRVLRTWRG